MPQAFFTAWFGVEGASRTFDERMGEQLRARDAERGRRSAEPGDVIAFQLKSPKRQIAVVIAAI